MYYGKKFFKSKVKLAYERKRTGAGVESVPSLLTTHLSSNEKDKLG